MNDGKFGAAIKYLMLAVGPLGIAEGTQVLHEYYPAVREFGVGDSYLTACSVAILLVWMKLVLTGNTSSIGSKMRPMSVSIVPAENQESDEPKP